MTQQIQPSQMARIFGADVASGHARELERLGPRYNVAPTQPLAVVVQRDDGRFVEAHRWGLVPSWAESAAAGSRMINARAETITSSPAFRASFAQRRCIVPADGFYEWRREGKSRQPFLISTRDGAPLAMAGIWSPWRVPASGDWLLSAAVVTTAANETVAELHDRMPVLLAPADWPIWLDPSISDADFLRHLLRPAPNELLTLRPVSRRLNKVDNEGPELLVGDSSEPLTLFGRG